VFINIAIFIITIIYVVKYRKKLGARET